jgi:Flp pilus assembly protein TadG
MLGRVAYEDVPAFGREGGQAMVESLFIIPLLLALIVFGIDLAYATEAKARMENAAAQTAAQVSYLVPTGSAGGGLGRLDVDQARTIARGYLANAGFDKGSVSFADSLDAAVGAGKAVVSIGAKGATDATVRATYEDGYAYNVYKPGTTETTRLKVKGSTTDKVPAAVQRTSVQMKGTFDFPLSTSILAVFNPSGYLPGQLTVTTKRYVADCDVTVASDWAAENDG